MSRARAEIDAVLDEFHAAAAAADEERYFATLDSDAIFLGTGPGERWQGEDFRTFVHGYFSRGVGWSYAPSNRSVDLSPEGTTAWFDETVANEHYGDCRGSGILRNTESGWRIAQYNLTIPVPDAIAPDVVARIRDHLTLDLPPGRP
jgi:ketosteroid isomerase-like protein